MLVEEEFSMDVKTSASTLVTKVLNGIAIVLKKSLIVSPGISEKPESSTNCILSTVTHSSKEITLIPQESLPRSPNVQISPTAQVPPDVEAAKSTGAAEDYRLAYEHILENQYKGGANGKLSNKDNFPCMCHFNPETDEAHMACGEGSNCINRDLFVECRAEECPAGRHCMNQRFQKWEYAPIAVIKTELKGFGIKALAPIRANQFIIEYCGEVLTKPNFVKRTRAYSDKGVKHFYFMSLKNDEIIDAQMKGNISRFINHSCNPSCVLQKWVVNSRLRMGIFATRDIAEGEELTFDYKFERYGSKAQKCYCGEDNCKGFIGGERKSSTEFDEEAEYDEEDEEEEEEEHKASKFDIGLQTRDEVMVFVKYLHRASKISKIKQALRKIESTDNLQMMKRFLDCHGLLILKYIFLEHAKNDLPLLHRLLKILKNLPFATRTSIVDLKFEDIIAKYHDSPELEVSQLAKDISTNWASLPLPYRIPKRSLADIEAAAKAQKRSNPDSSNSSYVDKKPRIVVQEEIAPGTYVAGLYKKEIKEEEVATVEKRKDRTSYSRYSDSRYSEASSSPNSSSDSPSQTSSTARLPPNWKEAISSEDGSTYYYHVITNQTQWERPRLEDVKWDRRNDLSPVKKQPVKVEDPAPQVKKFTSITTLSSADIDAVIEEATKNEEARKLKIALEAQKKLDDAARLEKERKKEKKRKLMAKAAGPSSLSSSHRPSSSSKVAGVGKTVVKDNPDVVKLRHAVSGIVIKSLSKFKSQIPDTEQFKALARKYSTTIVQKERITSKEQGMRLCTTVTEEMKRKIKKFVYSKLSSELGLKIHGSSGQKTAATIVEGGDMEISDGEHTPVGVGDNNNEEDNDEDMQISD